MGRVSLQMENALNNLYQWFCHHNMKINEAKTQMIVLGTTGMLRNMEPVSITFNGAQVQESRVVRNLGVLIDRNLTFKDHVDSIVKRCTGTLIALNHAQHVIPRSTLPCLTQALVISILRYCLSVYGSCSNTQLHRVQKIINFCARVVSGRRRHDHISDVVQNLSWLNAERLSKYHTVCAVHNTLVTGFPVSIHSTIGIPAAQLHDHHTRHANDLTLPRIRTESGRRRLCYRGVSMLNDLRLDVNEPMFKKSLKSALLSQ